MKNQNTAIIFIILLALAFFYLQKPEIIGLKVRYYKDGVEVFPQKGLFTIVTPPGESYNQISFDVIGSNTGDVSITNIQIADADPNTFETALQSGTIHSNELNVGEENKLLFTSARMDTVQFEPISPVNFWVNISGYNTYNEITIYIEGESGDITFEPELTCVSLGYECGTWDDGYGGILECGTCDTDYVCIEGRCKQKEEHTIQIYATEDATVSRADDEFTYGCGILQAKYWVYSGHDDRDAFIKFDVSEIPQDAVITSTILNLYNRGTLWRDNGRKYILINPVNPNHWNERDVKWDNQPNTVSTIGWYSKCIDKGEFVWWACPDQDFGTWLQLYRNEWNGLISFRLSTSAREGTSTTYNSANFIGSENQEGGSGWTGYATPPTCLDNKYHPNAPYLEVNYEVYV